MALIKEEHFGIARKIVSNMTTESWREIPHAIVMYEADVTDILPVVKALNANCKSREEKITLNTVMMKIICEGLKAAPSMNTHLLFNRRLVRGCLKYFDHIDVSMPMLLPDGQMMTVNMRDMGNKTLSEMTAAIVDTERRARNSNMNEVMYEVSLDNTLQRLKQGKVAQTVLRLILLPWEAVLNASAIVTALWRMTVSHRDLLQWQTAAQRADSTKKPLLPPPRGRSWWSSAARPSRARRLPRC